MTHQTVQIPAEAICSCCEEAFADRAKHIFDQHRDDPWRYRGSGQWNCPFCFEVCYQLKLDEAARGHADDVCRSCGGELLGHVYVGGFGSNDVPSCAY